MTEPTPSDRSFPLSSSPLAEWRRDAEENKIAGVCAGIAAHFDLPVTAVRTGFVLAALPMFSGIGIALYLVLWFLMPGGESGRSGLDRLVDAVSELSGEPRRPHRRAAHDADIEAELSEER